ncbi:single-stranded-DNA-specific exonuclease [Paraliobacillus quinghaiensis]|uniref:Single-stranded-DNA-specific exonuclease RecJ n=1 Tax=Paraliobacillus quinghaiensis TaxID=470815 RepID=A0A917TQV4_9BACI|nr:single-stranded-DNA-specific exonuclease RecJ [Paraliobacillus quinghaiensis]GGM30767.1 single-stranded-DNA-specific exonuclease [Paraliobacillus quinghaiensis]
MLQSQTKWKFTHKQQIDQSEELADLALSPTIKKLLAKRNIKTNSEVSSYLQPNLNELYEPSLLDGIEKAKQRINQAIENGESILVFGDYDADGVTATAILVEALRELGAMCDYYIPNRFTEGYGPNEQAFREAKKQGFQLIITVDTGIAAIESAIVAKEIGMDLIITDHHELQESVPEALAIIHPKCSEKYPFKELAGAGVAFKLAQHLLGYFPEKLLDLVVIGTIADLVPLVDENRVLAYHGLKAISQSKRPGIQALIKICSIQDSISEEDIGFLIGPRINAVGRLQSAYPAVELLLTEDQEEADMIANQINTLNQERQQIVTEIASEAAAMVEASPDTNKNVIVVAKEGWNQGVLGIVASKLVRTFQRPAIVLTIQNEVNRAKGSARSIPAFDLFANGMQIKESFLQFGGHSQAAGMTLEIDKVDEVRRYLNQLADQQLKPEDYQEEFEVEDSIDIDSIDIAMIHEINRLAPFGMGNPKPLFHFKAKPIEQRQIGSQKNHLKMMFRSSNTQLNGIGFGMGHLFPSISTQAEVEMVGYLQVNEWNGKKSPQVMIKDLAIQEWQLFDYRGSNLWEKQVNHLSQRDSIIISFQKNTTSPGIDAQLFTFEKIKVLEAQEDLGWIKNIVLMDLPDKTEDLEELFTFLSPEKIFACYRIQTDHFMQSSPTRDDFKWFYAMLLKRGYFHMKNELELLSKSKGWKINKIEFIIQVFSELEFVKINDGVVKPNNQVVKRDLSESDIYKQSLAQSQMEQVLYYSSYTELKTWLSSQMEQDCSVKEEIVNEL